MRTLRIDHTTEYRFGAAVTLLPHRLLVRPRENHNVRIASSTLEIQPSHRVRWQRDVLDNSVAVVTFDQPASYLKFSSSVTIEHYEEAPLDFYVERHAVRHPFSYLPSEASLLAPFFGLSAPNDRAAVEAWLRELDLMGAPMETYVLVDTINRAIHERFRYQARDEPGVWSPAETISRRSGACRDFAALLIDACRRLGLASRFVSGYLHAPASEAGYGATHAWAEVYLPGPGWKGFDPTAGEIAGSHHIAVAVSRDPEDVPPVAGSFEAPLSMRRSMQVYVRVQPEPGTPRGAS